MNDREPTYPRGGFTGEFIANTIASLVALGIAGWIADALGWRLAGTLVLAVVLWGGVLGAWRFMARKRGTRSSL
jgi:dipeptide/tripeptide permease